MTAAVVSDYPWAALDTVALAAVQQGALVRRLVERAVRLDSLAAAVGETLAAEVKIIRQRIDVLNAPQRRSGARVDLELSDGSATVALDLEPQLATAALARILNRPVHLVSLQEQIEPSLAGALAAVVVEVARRAGQTQPLLARPPKPQCGSREGVLVEATVVLDGRPFWVSAWVRATLRPTSQPPAPVSLEQLGPVEVAVPLVAGVSLASKSELSGLQPGDAWLCGDGWMLNANAEGRCVLAAPGAERGVAVDLTKTGEIVLRHEAVDLVVDVDADEAMTDPDVALANTVLDAPFVVRVEVGAVSMLARDWAKLAPGDVVLTGRRIAEPAVLRVAGREVARGELVNVDGELAVRIQQIKQGE